MTFHCISKLSALLNVNKVFPSEENCMLQVFNSLGQVVYLQEVSLKSQSIQMAISGLPAGSYVLRVSNDRFQKSLGPLMIMKD